MKKNNLVTVFTLVGLVGFIGLVIYISNSYISNKNDLADCSKNIGKHFSIDINNDLFNDSILSVKKCDTATVTNFDNRVRLMAFGQHDNHKIYDGIEEKELVQNQSFNFTFNEIGKFKLHDHNQDNLELLFTVTK